LNNSKIVLNSLNYWNVFFWTRIGSLLLAPLLFSQFNSFIKIVKKVPLTAFYLSVVEILNMLGLYLIVIAYSIGTASLVCALSEIQPLVVLFLAALVSMFVPNIIKEELKGSNLLLKIVGIIMMIIGAIFIQI
jgi:hypothetical protein